MRWELFNTPFTDPWWYIAVFNGLLAMVWFRKLLKLSVIVNRMFDNYVLTPKLGATKH